MISTDYSGGGGGSVVTFAGTSGSPSGHHPQASPLISGISEFFGGHSAGSGKMAARGAAEAARKEAILQGNLAGLAKREDLAWRETAVPQGQAKIVEFNPDPKVKALLGLITNVQGAISAQSNARKQKKLRDKEIRLERKLAKRFAKTADQVEVRVTDLYGPNAGYWHERGAPPPLWLFQE